MSASSPAPPSGSVFRFAAAAQPCGVLVNSPHSGRYYSPQFLASSQLDALALRRSEDAWVDELLLGAPAAGYTAPSRHSCCAFLHRVPHVCQLARPSVRFGLSLRRGGAAMRRAGQ
ncbi:MAG: N-formylglutamate amidohydrolase, partial [Hyphomicrobiales bacterium]|nr:N-formylglutamate amidohydrolase [Hyphomicrobiales bacterium]